MPILGVCADCAAEIDDDNPAHNSNGQPVCSNCAEAYIACDTCAAQTLLIDAVDARVTTYGRSTRPVCSDCAIECADCQTTFASADLLEYRNPADDRICGSCAEDYGACAECGVLMSSDSLCYHEGTESEYCPGCMPDDDDDGSEIIQSYGFRPSPIFHRTPGESHKRTARYFGIELEMENRRESDHTETADLLMSRLGGGSLCYAKYDSSVPFGFELVSHPATIDYWRALDMQALESARRAGYRSYHAQSSCGLHVHVSRAAVSELTILKLLLFDRQNPRFIRLASRRSGDMGFSRIQILRGPNLRDKIKFDDNRYTAWNLCNTATIERRIFRGTMNAPAVLRCIEFTNAQIIFAESHGLRYMSATKFREWLASSNARVRIGRAACATLLEWIGNFRIDRKREVNA